MTINRAMKRQRDGGLKEYEQRVLDGDVRAMRALVRQASGPNTLEMPFHECELRAVPNGTGGTRLQFNGYASVTEQPYEMQDWLGPYTEVVNLGAFKQTLSMSPDVIFCLNHNWDAAPMARTNARMQAPTLTLEEDSVGLLAGAALDGSRADVYQVQSCMEADELDAMSFAFYTVRQMWSPDYEQRNLIELDIDGGDASVVIWPANPGTTGTTALRKRAANALARSRVPALITARAHAEKRAGATLSAATLEVLQQVLDLVADADIAVDAAQPLLAELMGVANPDTPGETPAGDESDGAAGGGDEGAGSGETQSGPSPDMIRARLALLEREMVSR